MSRVALLVGVSQYQSGLAPLVRAGKDVQAMQRTLLLPQVGFAEVVCLCDRPLSQMQEQIEAFCKYRQPEDQILFLFAGYLFWTVHQGQAQPESLYFATPETALDSQGQLIKARALSADFVLDVLNSSLARQQVVILDACLQHSCQPAIAPPDQDLDLTSWLRQGRVVLAATTHLGGGASAIDQSIAPALWSYTRYLVDGIETAAADGDGDGSLSLVDWHNYATRKLKIAAPAMSPRLFGEAAPDLPWFSVETDSPAVRYRKLLERLVEQEGAALLNGQPLTAHPLLGQIRQSLNLSPTVAKHLAVVALRPFLEYRRRLQIYQQQAGAIWAGEKDALPTVEDLRQILWLREQDTAAIDATPYLADQRRQRARYEDNLARYEQVLLAAMQRQYPLADGDRQQLEQLQQLLKLRPVDVQAVESGLVKQLTRTTLPPGVAESAVNPANGPEVSTPPSCLGELSQPPLASAGETAHTTVMPSSAPDIAPDIAPTILPTPASSSPMENQPVTPETAVPPPETLPAATTVPVSAALPVTDSTANPQFMPTQPPASSFGAEVQPLQLSQHDLELLLRHLTPAQEAVLMQRLRKVSYSPSAAGVSPETQFQTPDNYPSEPVGGASPSPDPQVEEAVSNPAMSAPLANVMPAPVGASIGATNKQSLANSLKGLIIPGMVLTALFSAVLASYPFWKDLLPLGTPVTIESVMDPAQVQQLIAQGVSLSQQGQHQDAIAVYNQAIQLNPNSADAYMRRGLAYHQLGDTSAALRDYNQAIDLLEEARKAGGTAQQLSAIDKKMAQAYNNRSHVYFDRKEYQVSEKDASQAMSLDNSLLEAQVNLGNARFKLNKTQAALQDYNRVIQRQPPNRNLLAGTYTNRGNLQLSLDNPEAALQDYNQAITLDPTYADAYFNRGLLHESRGNAAQAIQDYEKAAALYGQQGQSDLQKKATERAANLKRD